MQEFLNFYDSLDVNWGIILFMMFFSAGVAIFHTVILRSLININYKPSWLLFALNPTLIGLAAIFDKRLGVLMFGILFISVFVLAILGMIISAIREGFQKSKAEEKYRKKKGLAPKPLWRKILITFSSFAVFGLLLSFPAYYILLIFIIFPFLSYVFGKENKKIFYKLQRTLPTSRIRSVAMGLAELSGKVIAIESMTSRIGSKKCIGYLYTIEKVSTDREGKKSYSLQYSETICNSFYLEDHTEKIKIDAEDIEFIDFEIDKQYQSSMKRYTQYLLQMNMNVLLIGEASLGEANEPIFKKENVKNVFGIAPIESVENYNNFRPIIQSAGYFTYFWVFLIALILLTPIALKNDQIEFGKLNFQLPFQNANPVNSIEDFFDNIYNSYTVEEEIGQEAEDAEGVEYEPHSDKEEY